jgi:hypothetical protein
MNVTLHIERLVLEGFALNARDAALVEAAVQAELTRLFAQHEAAASSIAGSAMPSVQGAPFHLASAADPSRLGSAIAQSVHGAIVT